MKFGDVVEHLGKRGFVTREKWAYHTVIWFGMDNVLWEGQTIDNQFRRGYFVLCLDDIWANDWIIIDQFWNPEEDDREQCPVID